MTTVHESVDQVFERIDDAFFALDRQWRFTFLNDAAEEALGVDRGELIGTVVWDAFEPAVDTTFQREYERAIETQEPVSFEEYYEPLDTWFEVTAYPSESGLSVYFRDVSDRVRRERTLERYRSIVETVDDGIYVVDDGTFEMVNDAYAEMVGRGRDELVGNDVSEVVDEETARRARELEREMREADQSVASLETKLYRPDGTTIEAEATFALLPTGERVGVVRDVTESRERERQLERYERIIETVDDGIYAVDDNSTFLVVNDAFCEMTGYDREELIGASTEMLTGDQTLSEAQRMVEEMRREERDVGVIEAEIHTKTDDPVPVEVRFEPYHQGDEVARCGVVRDVSDRREWERKLRSRVQQQEVVASLGRRALETDDVDDLMATASRMVAETLDTDYCKVLDLDAEDEELLLRQGVGWDEGVVGSATVSAVADDSQAAYTLAADEPIVVRDLATESRFDGPSLLTDHDVKSGISTVIGPSNDPWGILGAHDTGEREFSEHSVSFVQSVANTLAAAVDRHRTERRLRRQRERLAALSDIDSLVHGLAESVFEVTDRSELDEMVCERLADADSYEFGWIGVAEDGEVALRGEGGVDGYLDDLTLELDGPLDELGPTARAHRTGEVQVVEDVETDPQYEPWREHAHAHGYRSSAAVPIVSGDDQYGTLNLYSNRPDAFGEEEREALRRLGSILAYAILYVERRQKLQRERNRLEFMNRLLRHNLLNSLNVVEARLDLLEGHVDYEVAQHLDTAAERTTEMVEFVETVRQVTKVIGRGEEQDLHPVDLGSVLAERVERAVDTYPEAEFHVESPPDVEVIADDLLGEVLDNLLNNAVQHNPGEDPTVRVETTVENEAVVVAVADDGPGLTREQKETAFDRGSKTFDDPGDGFGLYLVAEIVDSYGGSVAVEDSGLGGARFVIRFERA